MKRSTVEESTDVSHIISARVNASNNSVHAVSEDFEQIFATLNTVLLRLSLQLTANAEKAEACLMLAMQDCLSRNNVPRDRANVWAHRMVIRNAVRLVWGTSNDVLCGGELEFYLQPRGNELERLQESIAILGLPVLDRLAFVICVVERYSIVDCAVLLGRTPQVVQQAIVRATMEVVAAEEGKNNHGAAAPSADEYREYLNGGPNLESSWIDTRQ